MAAAPGGGAAQTSLFSSRILCSSSASSLVFTRTSMVAGALAFFSSSGGLGTQTSSTLFLPVRLHGMLGGTRTLSSMFPALKQRPTRQHRGSPAGQALKTAGSTAQAGASGNGRQQPWGSWAQMPGAPLSSCSLLSTGAMGTQGRQRHAGQQRTAMRPGSHAAPASPGSSTDSAPVSRARGAQTEGRAPVIHKRCLPLGVCEVAQFLYLLAFLTKRKVRPFLQWHLQWLCAYTTMP